MLDCFVLLLGFILQSLDKALEFFDFIRKFFVFHLISMSKVPQQINAKSGNHNPNNKANIVGLRFLKLDLLDQRLSELKHEAGV